ncbi:MFS transporter [Methanogenium organophilum]|uniref:MFS transporter n=1 Tax=Methanogenium organophilum TaxID=2199 RepID=A0A9X9S3X9_METOG|nr:MFS transporter [Methanogenium organophilum]WAI01101.1 MFS transporter [Methanogenium organophilum]
MEFKAIHLLMLCCTAFFAMAGGAVLAPVLPEMVEPLHTTAAEIGLMISVLTISTAIFTLVVGYFIDRVNRKTILVPCLIFYGLPGLVCFFISDFHTILVLRFIQGIGVSSMMTLALMIIGEVYEGHDSVMAISRISMSIAIGAVSAPLIGGSLAMLGWNYPFLFYALSLPFAVLILVFLPETSSDRKTGTQCGITKAFASLKDIRICYTVFLAFTIFFMLFALIIYVPFLLRDLFGFTSGGSGLMLAIEGLAVVILASRVRNFTRKFSMPAVISMGFTLIGIAMIGISFVPSVIGILLLLMLFGAGFGLAQTTIDVLIVKISPQESRGGILSIHNCMKYVGQSLSPVIFAVILVHFGINTVLLIAGILGLLIALMTCLMIRRFENPVLQPVADGKPAVL